MNQLLDYLYCKPLTGFITSITAWFFGTIQVQPTLAVTFAQENVLWYLQIISLLIGCVAGVLTIICLLRRKQKKCK